METHKKRAFVQTRGGPFCKLRQKNDNLSTALIIFAFQMLPYAQRDYYLGEGESVMEKKALKRPSRILLVLMCIVMAIVLLLDAVVCALVVPNLSVLNSFVTEKPSGQIVEAAKMASADMTQKIEEEGIVLLDNKSGALPLQPGIAVNLFGYGSRDTVYGGTGSGSGSSTGNVTIAEGLKNAGFSINEELVQFYDDHYVTRVGVGFTGSNFDINETPVSEYSDELIDNAKKFSDVAVFVISRFGGEGADLPMEMDPDRVETRMASGALVETQIKGGDKGKHYLELQSREIEVLDMVKENFGTVIVLVNSTNAMELGFLEDSGIDAALWVGCLGSTGANAIGTVLSGAVNPSGRTSDTFAYDVESAPSYYSLGLYDYPNVTYVNTNLIGNSKEPDVFHYVDYIEGIYVGYRYYETAAEDGFINYEKAVQYPFGYGLSYTEFTQEIANFQNDGATITMDVTVTNTGSAAGKEVVQVYFSAPYTPGGIEKSHVVLADFTKTGVIEPGQSETVTPTFAVEDMASYDYTGVKADGGAYVLEAGDYQINLQNNSHDVIDSRTVIIAKDVIYNDANDGPRASDDTAAVNQFDEASFGENVQYVSRADWAGTMPTERAPATRQASEAVIAGLTDDSVYNDPNEADIVTKNNGLTIADMKGLDYDDPQWELLLQQVSVSEMVKLNANAGWLSDEVKSAGKSLYAEVDGPNGINDLMGGRTGNQYCAQSVLACSWSPDLAREMGETYGKEAAAMGISGLYAPAMNIHRSPFSGRNYEYYSEDGCHSGKLAAAEIVGIQSNGITTYSKHFAVNDQESNRDSGGLATWVSEQAMREIYLKGFELAVKDGGARGMMSSFNRLGTTCAAESYALLTTVLRDEWGFRGTVITDCILQLSYIRADRAVRAGNDLMLSLFSLNSVTDQTTGTSTGRQALRNATHNVLYSAANSDGEALTPVKGLSPIFFGLFGFLIIATVLCVVFFVRRHMKMKAWRAAQTQVI